MNDTVPRFASPLMKGPAPRFAIPELGVDPDTAHQMVHDELMLDGNARLNLATFVQTYVEAPVMAIMNDAIQKNAIDKDEYPYTAEIESRCVTMLAQLWNSPDPATTLGTSTTGSSDAAMLAAMAAKWRWRQARQKAGKPADKPNLVLGINAQICWDKFCRYWDVEPRFVPMEGERYHLSAEEAIKLCDENTIAVMAIMGSTFDGSYEPVKEISDALDKLQATTGLDIPIHVDGASGGFIAPFIFKAFGLDWLSPIIALMLAFGVLGGVVTWVGGPSKGLLVVGKSGFLPPWFQKTNKAGVQINILIVQGIIVTLLSIMFVVLPSIQAAYQILSQLTVTLYLIMYLLMFGAAIRLRYSQPDRLRAYRVPGGNVGMWIIGGAGFLGSLLAFVLGFFPPSQIQVGSPAFYIGALVAGNLIFFGLPLLIYAIRKPEWRQAAGEDVVEPFTWETTKPPAASALRV